MIRNYLVKCYIFYKGDNIKMESTNDSDFMTLIPINNINWKQRISYEDEGFKYTFDICSLFNLYKNGEEEEIPLSELQNPYNRKVLPWMLYKSMRRMIYLSRVLKMPINLLIEDNSEEELTEKKKNGIICSRIIPDNGSKGFYNRC